MQRLYKIVVVNSGTDARKIAFLQKLKYCLNIEFGLQLGIHIIIKR